MKRPGPGLVLAAALAGLLLAGEARGGDTITLNASLTVLSAQNCRFRTPTATLNFGTLYTGATSDATADGTIDVRCNGGSPLATYAITDNGGQNGGGPGVYRMLGPGGTLLPYQFTYSPATDTIPRNTNYTIALHGRILYPAINAAQVGAYADTVTLSLLP